MIYDEIIQYLKNDILYAKYPPNFKSDLKFYQNNSIALNCYAYALQLKTPLSFPYQSFYSPGNISQLRKDQSLSIKHLVECLIADCQIIGINAEISDFDDYTNYNSYLIAIILEQTSAYWHMFRKNDNGIWSEKNGWVGSVELLGYNIYHKFKDAEYQVLKLTRL